jgi:hypothetical protein
VGWPVLDPPGPHGCGCLAVRRSALHCTALQGLTQISSLQLDNSFWRPPAEGQGPVDELGEDNYPLDEVELMNDWRDTSDPDYGRFSEQQYDFALRPLAQVRGAAMGAASGAAGAVWCCGAAAGTGGGCGWGWDVPALSSHHCRLLGQLLLHLPCLHCPPAYSCGTWSCRTLGCCICPTALPEWLAWRFWWRGGLAWKGLLATSGSLRQTPALLHTGIGLEYWLASAG